MGRTWPSYRINADIGDKITIVLLDGLTGVAVEFHKWLFMSEGIMLIKFAEARVECAERAMSFKKEAKMKMSKVRSPNMV